MKILIATNRLTSYTGSEVIALEVAEGFQAKGHSPLLVANAVSPELLAHIQTRGLAVTCDEVPAVREFDIIWSQHSVLPRLLDETLPLPGEPKPYTIFVHLSYLEPSEFPAPVIEDLFADLILANSPATREWLAGFGLAPENVRIFPNPAPEAFRSARGTRPRKLAHLLAVSNHLPSEVAEAFEILSKKGIAVKHLGFEGQPKRVLPEDLAAADAVITIGKTTQYALLAGVPVYCYDRFGGPGWLGPENIDLAEHSHFSGRCCERKLTARQIADELLNGHAEAGRFAAELDPSRLQHFVLEPFLDAILEAAASRQPWTAKQARRLARWSGQIARARAASLVLHREVAMLETGRRQLVDYEHGLAQAQELAFGRLHEIERLHKLIASRQRPGGPPNPEGDCPQRPKAGLARFLSLGSGWFSRRNRVKAPGVAD